MTPQDIRRRGVVAHRACPYQKEKRKLRGGSLAPGRTETKTIKKGREKEIKGLNKGQQRWRRSAGAMNVELKCAMGATERKNRKATAEDRRKEKGRDVVCFGV